MNKMLTGLSAGVSLAALVIAAPAMAQSPTTPPITKDSPAATPTTPSPSTSSPGAITPKSPGSTMDRTTPSTTKSLDSAAAATGSTRANELMNASVRNAAGDTVGDISDLLIDSSGKIVNVVIGVGGFLGIGERKVMVPFSDIQFRNEPDGKLVVMSNLTKESVKSLPEYKATSPTRVTK